jgi:hypothetical protein
LRLYLELRHVVRYGHANGAKFACDVLQNILEVGKANQNISIRIKEETRFFDQ